MSDSKITVMTLMIFTNFLKIVTQEKLLNKL
jgi:hypothetical protein